MNVAIKTWEVSADYLFILVSNNGVVFIFSCKPYVFVSSSLYKIYDFTCSHNLFQR